MVQWRARTRRADGILAGPVRLTDALIAREKYRGEPFTDESGREQWPSFVLWDDEVPGLGVRIYPSFRGRPSRKDFIVTWRVGLKSRTMGIGTFGSGCTLRQARRTAREALDLARRGRDPIEERHQALGIGTAEDLASRFLFEHTAAKKKTATGTEPTPAVDEASPAASAEGPSVVAESEEEGPAAAPDEAADPALTAESPAASTAVDAGLPEGAELRGETAPFEVAPAAGESLTSAAAVPPGAAVPDSSAVPGAGEADQPAASGEAAPPAAAPVPADDGGEEAPAAAAAAFTRTPIRPNRPTKVRLLPVSDALYREIERRARTCGMTMTAYLQELVERDIPTPSADEVLAKVQARQDDVAKAAGDPNRKK